MIDAKRLLSDCQALVRGLEADLRDELDECTETQAALKREHHEATVAKRTRRSAEEWTAERITQAAAAWVLGCVFVRFLEDNELVDTPRLSGTGVRLQRARDEETLYFREHPERTAREYLEDTFRAVAALPGCSGLFDERHNPLWQLPISGDAARALLERWREIDPQTGVLVHDFTDPAWETRFLGDLYQDLSEAARKQYALLQTPEFIEEFILERTLEPAIDEFGLEIVTVIDPACGSGHFLLGAFHRILDHWSQREPGADHRVHVERVLAALAGVDLNPFAVAIARFRLLIAALRACSIQRLVAAPSFQLQLAVGDSLLHGHRPGRLDVGAAGARSDYAYVYATEDIDEVRRLLNRQYHVVVGNPPYINPPDSALNHAYRDRYKTCHRQYALTVPFIERSFDLAAASEGRAAAGYVGLIASNSFMKREFGKKLVEQFLPSVDLTLLVDTSGAYIPGHGTPTLIIVGKNRRPVSPTIRTVMGIRAEMVRPIDPAQGKVWQAIARHVDRPGTSDGVVSVEDVPRIRFSMYPWTLAGGGASDLVALLNDRAERRLEDVVDEIGRTTHTGEDEAFYLPASTARTLGLQHVVPVVVGEDVRDYAARDSLVAIFPYTQEGAPLEKVDEATMRFLWPVRTTLRNRINFGQLPEERGLRWFDHSMFFRNRFVAKTVIAFAEVATHNHFALLDGRKVYTQTAPTIIPPRSANESLHYELLAILDSSLACFWERQTMMDKGGGGIGGGLATEPWERFMQQSATRLLQFPLPLRPPAQTLPAEIQHLASRLVELLPGSRGANETPTPDDLNEALAEGASIRARMVALQEELDWKVYSLYGLLEEDLTLPETEILPLDLGQRAFEISLARRVVAGKEQTAWFDRHVSVPVTELPDHWPVSYRAVIDRRIQVIESNRNIGLIERPEYKRRWQWESSEKLQERALREWLLNRLEGQRYWEVPEVTSCARLADKVRKDAVFRSVAELYAGRPDVDLAKLVETLVVDEAVPYLAAWRYTADGMRVRAAWERTWELQRREDAIDALCALPEDDAKRLTPEQAKARKQVEVGQIPLPSKYTSKHFRKGTYWQLRGKLDVPKERFILYPGCERAADSSPVIGWAGWNQLERSQALAQYVTRMRQEERWEGERLTPLLAGLAEQLPWVTQWHNEFDPSLGRRVGDAYADFLTGQLAELGLSPEDAAAWRPPEATRGRRARSVAV